MFQAPGPGSKITVTTRFPTKSIHHPSGFKDNVTTGTVMKSFRGDPPHTFRMSTTSIHHPVARVDLAYVIDMVGDVTKKQADSGVRSYNVKGKNGDYVVTNVNRKWSCTCDGFMYRHTCSHIREVTLLEHEEHYKGLKIVGSRTS